MWKPRCARVKRARVVGVAPEMYREIQNHSSGNKRPAHETGKGGVVRSHLWCSSAVRCCSCRCSCSCYCACYYCSCCCYWSIACAPPFAVRTVTSSSPGLDSLEVQERLHLAVQERSPAPLPRDLARGGFDVRPRRQQQLRGLGVRCRRRSVRVRVDCCRVRGTVTVGILGVLPWLAVAAILVLLWGRVRGEG